MKKYIFIFAILIISSFVWAAIISNFNGQPSNLIINFTGNQNQTYNITIYKNANISSAFMNLSGNPVNPYCYQETANASTVGDGSCGLNYTGLYTVVYGVDWNDKNKLYDGNWSSFTSFNGGLGSSSVLEINYSKPSSSNSAIWQIKDSGGIYNLTIPTSCFDAFNGTVVLYVLSNGDPNSQWYCRNSSTYNVLLRTYAFDSNIFEEAMIWTNITNFYPSNVNISINNTSIWNFTGSFNQTNNKTLDFSSVLNASINNGLCDCSGCSLSGNNCTINFTFHSDTAGNLTVSDLNITWKEYINPNLTINEPNTTYNAITYIPINITAVDDWQLNYCYYNITRGASLEVANTQIAYCNYTTTTVSGDATYIIHICVNDTSGNQNCSSATFKTTNYISPPVVPGGGGGGGGTQIIQVLANQTSTSVFCDAKTYPPLKDAWDIFMKEKTWLNFIVLWKSYWNYSFCKSSAAIIPIG